MYRLQVFVVMLVFSAGVVQAEESDLMTGPGILEPFKRDLQQALLNGLAQSPEKAIDVCKLKAPEIADVLSRGGVRLGRTSERLRNPSNIGPEWVVPILEVYANNPSDRAPRTLPLMSNRSGYVEPIIVKPLCLTCHGDRLSPQVSAQISKVYPADRAVGYQAGDLRGVFWVEFLN